MMHEQGCPCPYQAWYIGTVSCWHAKSLWPEIFFVEGNSIYLINNGTKISSIEGLGIYPGIW